MGFPNILIHQKCFVLHIFQMTQILTLKFLKAPSSVLEAVFLQNFGNGIHKSTTLCYWYFANYWFSLGKYLPKLVPFLKAPVFGYLSLFDSFMEFSRWEWGKDLKKDSSSLQDNKILKSGFNRLDGDRKNVVNSDVWLFSLVFIRSQTCKYEVSDISEVSCKFKESSTQGKYLFLPAC